MSELKDIIKLNRDQKRLDAGDYWKGYRVALEWVLWLLENEQNWSRARQALTGQMPIIPQKPEAKQ